MNARRWLAGSIGLFCCMVAGCGLDDRLLTLARSRFGGDAGLDAGSIRALAPRLEVVPASIDLGWVTTGFPARARLTIRNAGDAPLPVPSIGWAAGSAAELTVIQNRCDRDVAPGQTCEVRLQVVPAQPGPLAGTLEVQGEAGSFDIPVAALGTPAGDLILAPVTGSFEDYGGVLVGDAQEGAFTLSNSSSESTGVLDLRVNRPEFSLVTPGPGECVPGVTSLAVSESCNVRLAFTPAERGALDAVLTIASDVAGSVSLTLAGRGLLPGSMETSSPALDFDGVLLGQSARRSLTLANAGDEQVELMGASLLPEGVEGFTIQGSDCGPGTLLEGGQSCSVQVEFRPPRAGEELTAELVASNVGAEQPLSVPLRGVGLLPGSLEMAPLAMGEEDFGDVLVGESLERSFEVNNPGAQPSGVLELSGSDGFALVTPPGEGECVSGATSLVDGQRCSIRVKFTPAAREAANGALTVKSPLAGTVGLPLSGRGIVAGQVGVAPELNFGRVLTAASAARTLKLTNTGDQPLAPPTLAVSGNDDAQKAAFTFEPGCTEPVAVGGECELQLTFAPTAAVPHAASLDITSGASTTSVLLLGEALVPGSLVLAAAPGSSPAFGDVEIGKAVSKSFTLTNPGAEPSGALTITTDDNQFKAALGDCNQGDPAGLVDGASCTFSVAFTPTGSQAAAANVSVQSPGAGRAGIALSGRGRTKAAVAGAGTRDFGRAVIGAAALTVPENQFAWTVSNPGDLPTGMLVVTNDDPSEFVVGDDKCTGTAVAGKGTCQVTIRFRPGETGRRSGTITVRDPVGMGSAALAVSGTGVRLAGPGQSCRDADCTTGECTPPSLLCCDRICVTCEECSPEGKCVAQTAGAPCGAPTSGSQCFGANACKLPSGSKCVGGDAAGDAQCGLGHCEERLGGGGANDRICCDADCAPGFACNAAGTACEQPALGAGAECDPAAPRCGQGMDCTPCRGSGKNECTPRGQCCADCGAGFGCFSGQCQCDDGTGRAGIDCGSGLCAVARDGACCPSGTPGCSGDRPVCHAEQHVCVECDDATDCTEDREGTIPSCTPQGTCDYPCNSGTPKKCGDICIAPEECCPRCGPGLVCQPDGITCGTSCTGDATQCNNGQPQVCQGGVFVDAAACPLGQQCDPGTGKCACTTPGLTLCGGECVDTQTDERHCTICDAPCPGTTVCVGGRCLAPLGGACGADRSCAEGTCATNGICCQDDCTGPCQACNAVTGACDNLDTSVACATAVTCFDHELQCSTAPAIDRPAPPAGEGVCIDGRCATAEEICRQPVATGTDCLTEATGEPGTCTIGSFGDFFCELTVPPAPTGPLFGELCPDGVCGEGTCSTNGVCCQTECTGVCQACAQGTGVCEDHQTSALCLPVVCPPHDVQCSTPPQVDPSGLPPGESLCVGPNECATGFELCPQALPAGTTFCNVLDVQDGLCQIDIRGVAFCELQ